MPGPILVTDFDGTITNNDFYKLIIGEGLPQGTPDFWTMYLAGEISHFDAINRTFGAAPFGLERLRQLAMNMAPDPNLGDAVNMLTSAGWSIVITSAGCLWYIEQILERAGVKEKVEVHANPGQVINDRLVMSLPVDSPYYLEATGIDKAALARRAIDSATLVAFAGDGPPDLAPALMVSADLRFARGYLAEELTRRGEAFQPYSRWFDVAEALCRRS